MKDKSTISDDSLLQARVVDAHGRMGSVVSLEKTATEGLAWIQLDCCPKIRIPLHLLSQQPNGVYRLPFSVDVSPEKNDHQIAIPVRQEELHIEKRQVETGQAVLVQKTVSEREQVVDEPVMHADMEIERVAVGNIVDQSALPSTRYEGDTLVIPVLEEVVIVQRQTLLKEEIRITRHRREVHLPQTFVLRSEHITVQRIREDEKDEASE